MISVLVDGVIQEVAIFSMVMEEKQLFSRVARAHLDALPATIIMDQAEDTTVPPTQEDAIMSDTKVPNPETKGDEASQDRFKMRYILSGHNRAISSLKFSPDGTLLASSGGLVGVFLLSNA